MCHGCGVCICLHVALLSPILKVLHATMGNAISPLVEWNYCISER